VVGSIGQLMLRSTCRLSFSLLQTTSNLSARKINLQRSTGLERRLLSRCFCQKTQQKQHGVITVDGKTPTLGKHVFIAPNAAVFGDVAIDAKASIWYQARVKGVGNHIKIGEVTAVAENVSIEGNCTIGDHVFLDQGSIFHSCTISDEVHVGLASIIHDGAILGKHVRIEPGSVVSAGTNIPSGEVWGGNPATFVRNTSDEELNDLRVLTSEVYMNGQEHAHEYTKSDDELFWDHWDDQVDKRSPSIAQFAIQEQRDKEEAFRSD